MKGYPKFKYGDKVKFTVNDETYEGHIYIIDKNGTFEYPDDVSYDIMVDEYDGSDKCLFKHIKETLVEKA